MSRARAKYLRRLMTAIGSDQSQNVYLDITVHCKMVGAGRGLAAVCRSDHQNLVGWTTCRRQMAKISYVVMR